MATLDNDGTNNDIANTIGLGQCLGTTTSTPMKSGSVNAGPRCCVCGDEASGFHYGVDSCEGCKGFFRRCIIQGLTQQCANAEKCEITPLTRNSCQYCRLKKCFAVGMSRGASRLGRRPKRLKNSSTGDNKSAAPAAKSLLNIAPHPQSQLGVLPLSMAELEALLDKLNSQNRYNIKLPSLLAALGRLMQDGERSATDVMTPLCRSSSAGCSTSPSLVAGGGSLCRSDSSSLSSQSPVTRRPSPDTTGTESDSAISPTTSLANGFAFHIKSEPDMDTASGNAFEFAADKLPPMPPSVFSGRITSSYDARALVGTVYHQLREAEQRRRLLGFSTAAASGAPPSSAATSTNTDMRTAAGCSSSSINASQVCPAAATVRPASESCPPQLEPMPLLGFGLAELAEEARRLPAPGSERSHLVDQVIRSVVEAHCSTCNYTKDKVASGLLRYQHQQQMLAAEGRQNTHPDPMKVWSQFVANMAPVIRRVVSFSKFVPGFTELLQDDQIKLIKQGSFEVILARYVLLFTDEGMFVPDMSIRVPWPIMQKMPMGDFFAEQHKFAMALNRLHLTDGEVGILTAIMIINPERSGLTNHKAIHKLRGLMLQCLYVHMKDNHPDVYDKLFTETIAVLPLSDHINQIHSRTLNNLKVSSPDIKFPELHLEVYDGQP